MTKKPYKSINDSNDNWTRQKLRVIEWNVVWNLKVVVCYCFSLSKASCVCVCVNEVKNGFELNECKSRHRKRNHAQTRWIKSLLKSYSWLIIFVLQPQKWRGMHAHYLSVVVLFQSDYWAVCTNIFCWWYEMSHFALVFVQKCLSFCAFQWLRKWRRRSYTQD